MKLYIINTDTLEYPIYEGDYRLKYPSTSFPQDFEPEAPYAWVYETSPPVIENFNEGYREIVPIKNAEGIWQRVWEVYTLSDTELLAKEENIKRINKNTANRLLQATDWTQVADVPLLNKQEFVEYRAVLRNIVLNPPTTQVVFPSIPGEVW